ncbi:phosphohydrolase [Entomospira nematocerorum]|uniref:Phosphohydrolase n=1 Tax=Entomospira nematocerorum TaxID=2719987 RepID=A0A968GCS1_9SPIO|nr:phosphohydrolase [Entomospira nematocera]NIZ47465.1 phosphohydrolase [Entomospira nematocera]WDI33995.1 phosphohydrolase [Entomospira nematocera]
MIYRITDKEQELNKQLKKLASGRVLELLELLTEDEEVRVIQEYSNHVSVDRLNFNDHGPVHMRIVARNALHLATLLRSQGIKLSLTKEGIGDQDDEDCALLIAAFLHDIGMSLTRQIHEQTALVIAMPIINRMLDTIYKDSAMKYVVRSVALEAVLGHMGTVAINSYEAGIILVADGCDIERGRAELVMEHKKSDVSGVAKIGMVHQYSAYAIEKVRIEKGSQRSIAIIIEMNNPTGYFQVEETLLGKMNKSPIKKYIEVIVHSQGLATVTYLL